MNRKGDMRLIVVAAVVAAFVLVMSLGGWWGALGRLIFGAQLLGFNLTAEASSSTILGVNLQTEELAFFTGDSWRKINANEAVFVLGGYEFVPQKALNEFKNFYEADRRPKHFIVSANYWRYWDVFPRGANEGEHLAWGSVFVSTYTKPGFAGAYSTASKPYLGSESTHLRPWNNAFGYEEYTGTGYKPFILEQDKNPTALATVIAWRDQITKGRECEKYLPLELSLNNVQASPGQPTFYTVEKLDEYIFIDISKPVLSGLTEKWTDENCYNGKIAAYSDESRAGWKNSAHVWFDFTEEIKLGDDIVSRISWVPTPLGEFVWTYESSATAGKKVLLIDPRKQASAGSTSSKVPSKYWLDNHEDFYAGLAELTQLDVRGNPGAFNNNEKAYNIRVWIRPVNEEPFELDLRSILKSDGSLGNDAQISGRFVYAILDKYNTYLKAEV